MFKKKTPSKMGTKDYDYKLNNKLVKIYDGYKYGRQNKEEVARELWAKITHEAFNDSGKSIPAKDRVEKTLPEEKACRLVCAMLNVNIKMAPRRKDEKIDLETATAVLNGLKGKGDFAFDEFAEACQMLCMPVVIFMGKKHSGKKTIFNRLITEAYQLNDEKVRCSWIFHDITTQHPLQCVACVIGVLPVFKFGSNAGTEVSALWTQIQSFSKCVSEEPQARHVHWVWNWKDEDSKNQILTQIPIQLFTPIGEKATALEFNKPGPKYEYMHQRLEFTIESEIEKVVCHSHTVFDDVESVREAWRDIHHFSFKNNPRPDAKTPPETPDGTTESSD